MKKNIVIITCWYGPYPWYFPYYIHSCYFNPSIDFVIITDNDEEISNKPDNVIIIKKGLNEIIQIAEKKLGFEVHITRPYKLCDFKPAYGLLFPEIIEDYEFWGHADIDVVYGDIRNFLTEELLQEYDVISCRHDYITGTFCLFRNNEIMNTLFMQSKDYKLVLSSSENFCFDECNYLFHHLQNGRSIFDFPDKIQSMTYVVQKANKLKQLKAFFDFIIVEGTPGKVKWIDGKIIYKDKYEAMLYHLIKFKTECKRKTILNPIPKSFLFTPKTIRAINASEIPFFQTT